MKIKKIKKKNIEELNIKLYNLFHKKFNLIMQLKSRQLQKSHLLKIIRRDIARVKTLLTKIRLNK